LDRPSAINRSTVGAIQHTRDRFDPAIAPWAGLGVLTA
jgi:hypothetical protein